MDWTRGLRRSASVFLIVLCVLALGLPVRAEVQMARLEYDGGGDWYNNPEVIPRLMSFANQNTALDVQTNQAVVRASEQELFDYSIVYLTGHGNIRFTPDEADALRRYLVSGGFLYADNDYGMDEAFRREIKKIFPDRSLRPIPAGHPLYSSYYEFDGPFRTHDHYPEKPPRFFGIRHDGQWVVLYTYNSNPSDGWAPREVHGDPEPVRQQALRFGVNILYWVFSQ